MMVGDMEVPLRRRGGYAVTKGLMALALVGGCVLAFVPWGSHAASPAIAAAHAAAAPAKLTRETASKKWDDYNAETDAPPASPAPPPLPPLIPVGNPFDMCPPYAPALGFAGAASGLIFSNIGAAYGTGKAAQGISFIGVKRPELVFKNIVPIVMTGVLSIYGMIIGVIIASNINAISGDHLYSDYSLFTGFAHLAAGLTCGLCSLSCGIALGVAGDAGVRSVAAAQKGPSSEKLYIGMVLIQGTGSALGMYGLIVALIMTTVTSDKCIPVV
jgi:V-type H+-transporting ATPase proteolipid subunit